MMKERFFKKTKLREERGSSFVELILILPCIIVLLFFMQQLFEICDTKHALIKTARYMVWEKADYTGGIGGVDPVSTQTIFTKAKDMLPRGTLDKLTLQNQDTVSFSSFQGAMIRLCANNLGLGLQGKWVSYVGVSQNMKGMSTVNNLLPGTPVPENTALYETAALITDAWNAMRPREDAQSGQVWDRMSGLFPLGMLDITGGSVSRLVSKIIRALPFVPEPRKNLQAVPPDNS